MQLVVSQRDGTRHTILFDDTDAQVLSPYRWRAWRVPKGRDLFYAVADTPRPERRRLLMHSFLLGSPGVDHINHNGLDNRRANLRLATPAQQAANKRPIGGSSAYKGVSADGTGRWRAQIQVGGKPRYLGLYDDELLAARAYDDAARSAWGEYALLNFPEVTNA